MKCAGMGVCWRAQTGGVVRSPNRWDNSTLVTPLQHPVQKLNQTLGESQTLTCLQAHFFLCLFSLCFSVFFFFLSIYFFSSFLSFYAFLPSPVYHSSPDPLISLSNFSLSTWQPLVLCAHHLAQLYSQTNSHWLTDSLTSLFISRLLNPSTWQPRCFSPFISLLYSNKLTHSLSLLPSLSLSLLRAIHQLGNRAVSLSQSLSLSLKHCTLTN